MFGREPSSQKRSDSLHGEPFSRRILQGIGKLGRRFWIGPWFVMREDVIEAAHRIGLTLVPTTGLHDLAALGTLIATSFWPLDAQLDL